jgi:hypothetical protein
MATPDAGQRMSGTQSTFWELDDEWQPVPVRNTVIAPASVRDVDDFCRRWHYSGTGGNAMWRWGLWAGETLLGVVAYNLPTRAVCESVFGPEHFDKVWHMGRLAMADTAPPNSESRLIAGSLRAVQSDYPHVWAVVTFAAQDAGHVGYVYQATNAIYTGTGGDSTYYIDPDGRRRGTYLDAGHVNKTAATELGWEVRDGLPKHRYIYIPRQQVGAQAAAQVVSV